MGQARVWGAFALLGAIWGSSFLFIKLALADLEPFTLVTLRVGIGLTGLWLVVALTRRGLPRDTPTLLRLALVGLLNTAIPFVLITWGEKFIDSGVAGILNGTSPLWTILVAHVALSDERVTLPKVLGLVVGFAGVALIFNEDLLSGFQQLRQGAGLGEAFGNVQGQLAVVLAAMCYALSAVYIRRYLRHVEPIVMGATSQFAAFAVVAASALLVEYPFAGPISGQTWFAVAWLGALGVCVAYILYFFIIQQWGATRASLVTYILPVVAFALGAIVLGERLTWQVLVGGLLIIGGIWLVNRKTGRPARAAEGAA